MFVFLVEQKRRFILRGKRLPMANQDNAEDQHRYSAGQSRILYGRCRDFAEVNAGIVSKNGAPEGAGHHPQEGKQIAEHDLKAGVGRGVLFRKIQVKILE